MSNTPSQRGAPPPTRRDRREAARRDRRLSAARTAAPRPGWQSPMALMTLGAVAVGLVVILLASGILGGRSGDAGNLLAPIRPTPPELVDATDSRAVGRADAPVTIEVWSDFQCPACKAWALQIEPDLIEEYVKAGTVRLVYRDDAFIDRGNPGGESQQSAAAARCAGAQSKFWQYHDYLFENQGGENEGDFRRERLDQIATAIGLDMAAYGSCMDDDSVEAAVKAETQQGSAAGVTSTPTITVNGVLQAAGALPMADLRTIIDAELQKLSPPPGVSPSPSGS